MSSIRKRHSRFIPEIQLGFVYDERPRPLCWSFLDGVVKEFFDTSNAIVDGIYSLADMLTELNLTGTATTARMQQYPSARPRRERHV
ncbi:hypothetical protein CO652_22985 [Rhizobium sp. H4]|nr:hypothetical protein CO652_22985 [Rhizobium sp. H4]